jgi:hypothetical protein
LGGRNTLNKPKYLLPHPKSSDNSTSKKRAVENNFEIKQE